jgi:hypothetical protein
VAAWDSIFGDGSDGTATLDGTATVSWASKSGSTYTMTRDALLVNLTINNTVILKSAGYFLYGTGTLTVNSGGTLERNGTDASGTGLVAGSFCGGSGAGGLGQGAGGSPTEAIGAAGGDGGDGDSGSGGPGGNPTVPAANDGTWRTLVAALSYTYRQSTEQWKGGAGGGGGGDSGAGGGSVRGGVGGGVLGVSFATIVNNGTISAKGGNGANGIGDNGGGGGGGGGGAAFIIYRSYTGNAVSVAGGSGGTGTGTGTNGEPGSTGTVWSWEVGTVNTGPQGPAGADGEDGISFDTEFVGKLVVPAHPRFTGPIKDPQLRAYVDMVDAHHRKLEQFCRDLVRILRTRRVVV